MQQMSELAMELSEIHKTKAEEAARQLEAEKQIMGALNVACESDVKELEEAHQQQIQELQTEVEGLKTKVLHLEVQLDEAHGMCTRLKVLFNLLSQFFPFIEQI